MGKISKGMQPKHAESLPPYVKDFCNEATTISLPLLPRHLSTFATQWPFPRGDLYHWIPLLNRFDVILERFCKTYKLDEGPQTLDFACILLESKLGEETSTETHDLEELGYGKDGDRHLVETILNFSRMLLQNCGNRSIYASSAHLSNLLNSTSLSIIEGTLHLSLELAQRYQAALKRMNVPARHVSSALLANHYNIDLDRVLQLALPFAKTITTSPETAQSVAPSTPSVKGKEKAVTAGFAPTKATALTVHANDLVSMVKGGNGIHASTKTVQTGSETEIFWEQWGDVKLTYYPKTNPEQESTSPRQAIPPLSNTPVTPTPIRRASNLGPNASRLSRQTASEESPTPAARATTFPFHEEQPAPNFKVIEVSSSKLKSAGVHAVLRENAFGLPQTVQYELLTKLRIAEALTASLETRRQLLSIRLLAITNLAYVHQEGTFVETVLKQDSEDPRRLQLVYQLAELVHPPTEGDVPVPRHVQSIAFDALTALAEHQVKFPDVCAALNTNVNHGVLLYVVRKAVAEMNVDDLSDKETEADIWRCSLFTLVSCLAGNPRTGSDLVTAGLIPILVEVLGIRASTAERYQVTVLTFLDALLYSTRDAFQALVNANGLDAVSDLIVFEVKNAADNAASGNGIKSEYGSAAVDYQIPFFQQQTLKWLFKFIHHMMTTAGGYGGNFDRLLRNLIDSSQLLASLRQIIGNSHCFGSIVWTNAVSILNDFINNEPTSFAVIAEAGLSRGLLEAVTDSTITMPPEPNKPETQPETEVEVEAPDADASSPPSEPESEDEIPVTVVRPTLAMLQAPRNKQLAKGIMPTSETIIIIPQAFGAICLNSAGMKMFQTSRALESFFEIFESPEHVKCMDTNKDLPSNLGSTFDELVRHHPPLRPAIMNAILVMVARVAYLCKNAEQHKIGAKLWTTDLSGKPVIADQDIKEPLVKSTKGKEKATDEGTDVEMHDADAVPPENAPSSKDAPTNMIPYVTAVSMFLSAMFSNSSVRSDFSGKGGIEYVLDLAESPCLAYDFADGTASHTLQSVVALLAESKPHLTMPSLLRRAQLAVDVLAPFAKHSDRSSFFAPFVSAEARRSADIDLLANGTTYAKAFVNLQSLVSTIHTCFQASVVYNHRSASTSFSQLNLADYYIQLVENLGPLLGASLKEEMHLQKAVPGHWRNATRIKDSVYREPVADALLDSPLVAEASQVETPATETPAVTPDFVPAAAAAFLPSSQERKSKYPTQAEQDTIYFKNFQTLRYSLSKICRIISPFFQTLGKALVTKRSPEAFQKQSHVAIAEALAKTILAQLAPADVERSLENYSYWIGILHTLDDMLVDISRHNERPVSTITLVLQAFKDNGGFDVLNHILEVFTDEIRNHDVSEDAEPSQKKTEDTLLRDLATAGTNHILSVYSKIVNGKNVTESAQTVAMSSRDRERPRTDQFSPPQFLVEVRMAILPIVRRLWESDLIEKGSSKISEKLIDVIRHIATADSEANAVKRSDKVPSPTPVIRKTFRPASESLENLDSLGFDNEIATEALYRCNNNLNFAIEYCRESGDESHGEARHYPVPTGDIVPRSTTNGSSRPRTNTSTGTATPDDRTMSLDSDPVPFVSELNTLTDQAVSDLLSQIVPAITANAPSGPSTTSQAAPVPVPTQSTPEVTPRKQITVDDLNEERDAIRDNLIDKCLDVINAHGEVTFEVADLITTVVSKSSDPVQQRKSVGETLVVALSSFAGEEDLKNCGKKIAAYAHLLALMLRDKQFYTAAVGELKDNDNLSVLLSFVKLSPTHSADEPSPWVSQILLIIELLLSEDAKPQKTTWSAPKDDKEEIEQPVIELPDPAVPQDMREQLLEAILDILPRIGKDESLALSVLRILVILTRNRAVAQSMGDKKNIQRVFVMAKQLAGNSTSSSRISSPLMLILRHIIEDDETVKQIMRAEVKSLFESGRHTRNLDHALYLRSLAHAAIRNPELFVEVTNELVKYNRWTYQVSDVPNRTTTLVLKDTVSPVAPKAPEDSVQPTVQATEDLSIQDVKVTTEEVDSEMPDAPKPAHFETKFPVVENPDGVIHFLLCELLNYKDVDDKDPVAPAAPSGEKPVAQANGDVAMGGTSSTPIVESPSVKDAKATKPSTKPEFKAEDHPIYIYRCFILQCLTELLSSYNRTKLEFISFKRMAPPIAMTPSKPRSSVVNYLLFDLIPIGTLEHADTTASKKKLHTSSWADSVLTALLSKTGEQPINKDVEPFSTENEGDLLFVRRFVLENILKAYKEATYANEPLDVKYARMLSLADLMNHIMTGKENLGISDAAVAAVSQKQLRRIMFEKGYINALTTSIADMDLNFPGAKRAVKYILRPLKTLTTTAVTLSDLELISLVPGQNDADEIESATSVSDDSEEREETPDLFRNSTLGLFEPGRDGDSSSESDDEGDPALYGDGYDDEMDYEEDVDAEDNISDEDEEIEGMGPIEGLDGDHGVDVEVIMEDEDDEDDDEDSSDDDEDEDSEDDDGRVEIIDEAGDIQELVEGDEMGEWESDEDPDEGADEEDYEGEAADQEEAQLHGIHDVDGALGQLLRSLGGGGEGAAELMERIEAGELDGGDDEPMPGDYMEEGEDDEEDDEDDEDDDDEGIFDQYPIDGAGPPIPWQDDVEPPVGFSRRSRAFPPFPMFPGGPRDPLGGMSPRLHVSRGVDLLVPLRVLEAELHAAEADLAFIMATDPYIVAGHRFHDAHRTAHRIGGPTSRSADDGVNPLLQRGGAIASNRELGGRPTMGAWMAAMAGMEGPGGMLDLNLVGGRLGESPAALMEEVLRSLPPMPGQIVARNGLAFQITQGRPGEMPRDIEMMLGPRPSRFETRRDASDPGSVSFFIPQPTSARWLEEAKLLFGPQFLDRALDIANAIQYVLVPPAVEADKAAKAAEAERVRKAKEEADKKAEEERITREAKEAEEKAAREKKEAEEREAAELAAAEALAARGAEVEGEGDRTEDVDTNATEAMDGVEATAESNTDTAPVDETPAEDRPRVTTMIRGAPFDITDLGIDADFLAELPEELREEVIMSAVAERRSQAAATGAQPSELDQDFLDALPEDIRAEIVAQERQDRRRQQREAANRASAAANGAPPAHDMDAASILATLDPILRNQVLLEQDEDTLAMLPQELAEQARAAMRGHPANRMPRTGLVRRPGGPPPPGEPDVSPQRPARRTIVQMLDKPGVATLLRLMFVLQQGSLRSTLNSVLQSVSLNRHNRNEVLTTLLNILQDGSIDMAAVERSFSHLSLKAKQPKEFQPKTPITLKRALTNTPATTTVMPNNLDASPLLVVQQCLTCLVYLNQVNPHIPAFFLTEHDTGTGLKRTLSRKGKGKENKAAKYALNTLLALLDRDLIMESSAVMESLSTLLNMITAPLQALQRKQKEAEEASKVIEQTSTEAQDTAPAVTESAITNDEASVEPVSDTISPVVTTSAQPETTAEAGEPSTSTEPAKTETPKEPEKKLRPIVPPVIPEHNLQLVINIFVARECSSKTFRETLSTIKNLSAIPGAKAVFGRELISKAQALGEIILVDLEDLLPQIQRATTGTEIQGVALAKFSPGGSDQNKLLRVLTALDHLFDPKREKKDKPLDTDADGESSLVEKQDLLSSLYENSTFGPMWEKLSACLSAIRQREHMLNVATILLPLIEALMVVCKNTTLKDAPAASSKEMMLSSPPPESRMESLFFTFTEEHRKILNDLVRHTPKLMSGTFSLLVKNPKVLEFDNKRNYFSRSIHAKAPNARQSFPPLQLSVRRDQIFHDSFKSLYFQTGDQMKYGKLSIRFHGEEGVDAGGVTREWFQVLSRQMFDPSYALFVPVSSDRTTFHPNQHSDINDEHLMFFKFIGRIIGKALYEGRVLDCHFSRAVYKRILGKPVSVKDMESLDPEYYKSLIWMLENDITDIITETFSFDNDKFGLTETIDFVPNGRTIPVTEENKQEYVRLMVEWRLTGSVKQQLDEFLKGFHEIIPAELVSIFNEQELELLISGLPEIDVDDWKSNTELHNYSASSPQIQWFWRAVRSYDKEERAKLLQFVTGTSKVPLNGFRELEGMNGFSRFNIHRDYGNKDRLPSSHTCFNQLDLPEYDSYETLRQQVLTAITAGSEYFGFA